MRWTFPTPYRGQGGVISNESRNRQSGWSQSQKCSDRNKVIVRAWHFVAGYNHHQTTANASCWCRIPSMQKSPPNRATNNSACINVIYKYSPPSAPAISRASQPSIVCADLTVCKAAPPCPTNHMEPTAPTNQMRTIALPWFAELGWLFVLALHKFWAALVYIALMGRKVVHEMLYCSFPVSRPTVKRDG